MISLKLVLDITYYLTTEQVNCSLGLSRSLDLFCPEDLGKIGYLYHCFEFTQFSILQITNLIVCHIIQHTDIQAYNEQPKM